MSEPSWKCPRCGWETNELPSNHKCARCMYYYNNCKPPERSPSDVIVRQTIELGSVRGNGEASCTIRSGAGMFVGTLPKGLWRLYMERVG